MQEKKLKMLINAESFLGEIVSVKKLKRLKVKKSIGIKCIFFERLCGTKQIKSSCSRMI